MADTLSTLVLICRPCIRVSFPSVLQVRVPSGNRFPDSTSSTISRRCMTWWRGNA